MKFASFCRAALLWAIGTLLVVVSADTYAVAEGNRSMLVALGCFWCAEQAFEQYAPGVVEAVSGFAGGIMENPTYSNHRGHYEVALIEYDPNKTSYEVLVNYAYRNMDPFDSEGQFCDKGRSYLPAIFYETEEELAVAENVLAGIIEAKGWQLDDIAAPILKRPKFWTASDYHQDYYLKNPAIYGYYKNGCGRPTRLKEVWGLDEYTCYHEEEHTCFIDYTGNITSVTDDGDDDEDEEEEGLLVPTVINANGQVVKIESNIKGAGAEKAALMPRWATGLVILGSVLVFGVGLFFVHRKYFKKDESKKQYRI